MSAIRKLSGSLEAVTERNSPDCHESAGSLFDAGVWRLRRVAAGGAWLLRLVALRRVAAEARGGVLKALAVSALAVSAHAVSAVAVSTISSRRHSSRRHSSRRVSLSPCLALAVSALAA